MSVQQSSGQMSCVGGEAQGGYNFSPTGPGIWTSTHII